jgi:hypothetical protein
MNWRTFWQAGFRNFVDPTYSALEVQAILFVLYFASKERLVIGLIVGLLLVAIQYASTRKKPTT